MRSCSVCGVSKATSEYYFRNKQKQRLHSQCKQCYLEKRRTVWRQYYHKHGSKYRENAVLRNRKLKQELREKMANYLIGKSCSLCGNTDPRVLEFDHINPHEKSFAIAFGISSVYSWNKMLAEIEKCQILCANCHKIKTAKEQGWYKYKPIT